MTDRTEGPNESPDPSLLARRLALKLDSVTDHDQRAFLLREFVTKVGPDGAVRGLHVLIKSAMRGDQRLQVRGPDLGHVGEDDEDYELLAAA